MKKNTLMNLGISLTLIFLIFSIFIPIAHASTVHAQRERNVYANKGFVDKGYIIMINNYFLYESGSSQYFTSWNYGAYFRISDDDFEWYLNSYDTDEGEDALGNVIWLKIWSWGNLREVAHHSEYVSVDAAMTIFNDESYSTSQAIQKMGGISGTWWLGAKNYYTQY